MKHGLRVLLLVALGCTGALGQKPRPCSTCLDWYKAQTPFRIFGNTYYVGTRGLSSVLITSSKGHVLIDGGMKESAGLIARQIEQFGFHVRDVKVIVNSHVHYDHAGGIADLQRRSGARVVASEWSAAVLKHGGVAKDDPQYGTLPPIAAVKSVSTFRNGEPLAVGDLTLTPHITAGHTPGGTSWTWRSCEGEVCHDMVFADSLNPVSSPGFRFSTNNQYPQAIADFEKSFAFLETVPCDYLITAHPELSGILVHWKLRLNGVKPDPMLDPGACRALAGSFREKLRQRLAEEGQP